MLWLVEGEGGTARKGNGERAGAVYTACNVVSISSSSSGSSTGGTDGVGAFSLSTSVFRPRSLSFSLPISTRPMRGEGDGEDF